MKCRGYVRNPLRRALYRYTPPVASVFTLPASMDLRPQALLADGTSVGVLDQGQTGSCVAHATALSLVIARRTQGRPLPWVPSPSLLYGIARCLELRWGDPLTDSGCDPVDLIDAVQKWGMKAMGPSPDGRNSDVDPATVNLFPDLLSLEYAADLLTFGDYQITSNSIGTTLLALASGHPVRIVVPGGDAGWQNYNGGILSDTGGPLDHCVTIVGYDPTGFIGRNSWGIGWGDAGDFKCDNSVVARSTECIVTVAS